MRSRTVKRCALVRNNGKQMHEFIIRAQVQNPKHAALMLKSPSLEHDEPDLAHVLPGRTGQIVWTVNRARQFEFASLVVGHYQADVVGTVYVSAN